MAEGLGERKKRQTRQHISDVATGLFVERGFGAVTVAEIAEAADVSVNTVCNYFPAGEDLFLDRSAGLVDRLADWVYNSVMALIGCEMVKGRDPREVSREVLALLDGIEDLLSGKVLNYAVRGA
ncbi:TetR/AcrR family transcriptional regulator [Streptomyces sp. NPDC048179]|uniref:TetR/AcrR family transcriptional regulator n=1 Tax=Streptomyces sp. NPDC048179 TaxID=3365506 RepID=UPI003711A2C0